MAQFLIVLLALLLSSTAASAQAPTRIASGYSAISGPHAVLWMAREAGLFEKNGLRAEVAYIRSGTTMSQALLAGELQIAQTGGPAALQAAVGGADFVLIAVALNTTPIVLMGTVSKMEELKGKAIGVTRYGSNTDISARYALRKFNLQPDKDVALTEAIALYKNKPDLAAKVTEKYTGIKDPAILKSTVGFYAPKLARAPYPTAGGISFVLEQIAARDPRAKSVNPETLMDLRFVKQLDDSGFIKSLYSAR